MKTKTIFALAFATIMLASCGGGTSDPTTTVDPTTGSEPTTSVVDPTTGSETTGTVVQSTYSVTVQLWNGDPAVGVKIQLCTETSCHKPIEVDENGYFQTTIDQGNYEVHLQNVPEGFKTKDDTIYYVNDSTPDITIVLEDDPSVNTTYTVNVEYADGSAVTGVKVQLCTATTCLKPVEVDAEGKVLVEAPYGNYEVHLQNVPEGFYYSDSSYKVNRFSPETTVILYESSSPTSGIGSPYDRFIVKEGAYNVTIKSATSIVYFGFDASKPGIYVIESFGECDTLLGDYGANDYYVPENPSKTDDNSASDGKNFRFKTEIKESFFINVGTEEEPVYELGSRWTYGVSAPKEASYPVTFTVLFCYSEKVQEEVKVVSKPVKVTEKLSEYPDNTTDTLTSLPLDRSFEPVYNKDDGFYHKDTTDGEVILAMIAKPCKYLDVAIADVQEAGNSMLVLDYGKSDYTDFMAKYKEVCNEDGVYPMTQELKVFFEKFSSQTSLFHPTYGWITQQIGEVDNDAKWLFAAYTYVAA